MKKILEVSNLTKTYGRTCPLCFDRTGPRHGTNTCQACRTVVACHDVAFDLYEGEILGVIGESGSGKSTIVGALNFNMQPNNGTALFFDGDRQYNLFALNAAEQRMLANRRFGMVYQNPHLGLNFNISAGGNIAERLLMNDIRQYSVIRHKARSLLRRTEVPADRMDHLPSGFSGGMQQRVQIAKALSTNPPLLFLDEVTTGLDVSVQASILDLILELQYQLRIAMIVVTHDLGVIRLLAGRTIVMKQGRIVEAGLTDQILEDPQHHYTQVLVASALS
jgi:putative phosphonate transport system ATP-binding protein